MAAASDAKSIVGLLDYWNVGLGGNEDGHRKCAFVCHDKSDIHDLLTNAIF